MTFELSITNSKLKIVKGAVFAACLIPLALLGWYAWTDDLGANPIEVITNWTGLSALTLLFITLSVTPMRRISGRHWLIKLRRMLGLYAFFYASLHFSTYVWLDQFFNVHGMIKDVMKRPFITVGFSCFALLIPLALTSSRAMIGRLGSSWQRLHRLIYVAAIGGVIHFYWLVKADIRRPLIYGAILVLLLGCRLLIRWPGQAKRLWENALSDPSP